MSNKITIKEFIKRAKKTHRNRYDYSLVEYKNINTKIKIICKKHGIFEQTPKNHLKGNNCSKCYGNCKSNNAEFIEKARKIHGDKYDYSLVEYKNNYSKVKIHCNFCKNIFEQKPNDHLDKHGCPECTSKNMTTIKFIKKAKKIHGDKYDYSLSVYITGHTKIKIICPIHGVFEQEPTAHISSKQGCSKCYGNCKSDSINFINNAKNVHGDKYNYSLVEYKNNYSKIKIICNIHGIFEQKPNSHLNGQGCRFCGLNIKRLKTIKRIQENIKNGYQITPNFNKNACEIFNKIMNENNTFIQHAMNIGEYHIKELGYWLDGYDKENNIVYEFDEKEHFKNGKLRKKDKIRQKEIENFLNCKFIRLKNN